LFHLISRMLDYEVASRITLEDSLRHPFFHGSCIIRSSNREDSNDSGLIIRDSRSHSSYDEVDSRSKMRRKDSCPTSSFFPTKSGDNEGKTLHRKSSLHYSNHHHVHPSF
jgi:serine/threonine protein kinase